MPKIFNNTENPWTFPVTGLAQREVMLPKVVEGTLIYAKETETYPVAGEVKVLAATLSLKEREFVEVSKEELKGLEKVPMFQTLLTERSIEVI